ncbi:hypothetical protein AE16_04646, partial [Escherichia coli UCI 57]
RYDALENQCEESDLLAAEMKLIGGTAEFGKNRTLS